MLPAWSLNFSRPDDGVVRCGGGGGAERRSGSRMVAGWKEGFLGEAAEMDGRKGRRRRQDKEESVGEGRSMTM